MSILFTKEKIQKEIYRDVFLKQVPRILGQIDANPGSTVYGCCDRAYWHNNTVTFPNARHQEMVLTLALLYKDDKTPYYKKPNILSLINAMIGFWCKMQRADGSFDEWYPFEGSYVATAFSTYAVSETLIILNEEIDRSEEVLEHLSKSAKWLAARKENLACNQQTGGLLALYNVGMLTDAQDFKDAARTYEERICSVQKDGGWFQEYGGADFGYLSLSIDYLTKYYKKSQSEKIKGVIEKALSFLKEFVLKDGTMPGVCGSRDTEYLIPHGIEFWASRNKDAQFLAWHIRNNLKEGKGTSLHSLDDRYLSYIGYTFLQALDDGPQEIAFEEIKQAEFYYEKSSGLYIRRVNRIEVVANLRKKGTFSAFVNNRRIHDGGLLVEEARRNLFSGFISDEVNVISVDENGFEVEGKMAVLKEHMLSPLKMVAIQLFQVTFGRFSVINRMLKKALRKKLILNHRDSEVGLRRSVTIQQDRILIKDTISHLGDFNKIFCGVKYSFVYVPSCRWFQIENCFDEKFISVSPDQIKKEGKSAVVERIYLA